MISILKWNKQSNTNSGELKNFSNKEQDTIQICTHAHTHKHSCVRGVNSETKNRPLKKICEAEEEDKEIERFVYKAASAFGYGSMSSYASSLTMF